MIKIDPRQLWPAVCALAIAMVLPVLVLPDSRASRVATLDLEETGFEERYIQFLDSARTRASIVARDVTTLTRGETVMSHPPSTYAGILGHCTPDAKTPSEQLRAVAWNNGPSRC